MKVKNEHKLKNKGEVRISPDQFLKTWLAIHMIAIVIAIVGLSWLSFYLRFVTGLYLVDACVQFWCVRKLWDGELTGYRSLMILFVLRVVSLFFILSWIHNTMGGVFDIFYLVLIGNGLDACLLWAGVKKSKHFTMPQFPLSGRNSGGYPDGILYRVGS